MNCTLNPCLNDGTCVEANDTFSCECPNGLTGTRCELDIDDCRSDPCMNGGTCNNTFGSFTCQCPNGFSGDRCEIDSCDLIVCLNNGTCVVEMDGNYSCRCIPDFTYWLAM